MADTFNRPRPREFRALPAFWALFRNECYRFLRIPGGMICAPIISSILYLIVFGATLDSRVQLPGGLSYREFLVPGLVIMSLLQNAFANTVSSIMTAKISGAISFILMPPIGGLGLASAWIGAGIARGFLVGGGVLLACCFWGVPRIEYPLVAVGFGLCGAMVMSSLGVVAALWAEKWDQINAVSTFVVMPLTFLSGVFYSTAGLAEPWQTASQVNPFFFMVDGFRYGFFGTSDVSPWTSCCVVTAVTAALVLVASALLRRGWRLKK